MAQTIKNLASGRLTADITAVATSLSVYVGEGTSEEIEGVWPDTPFYATITPNEPVAGVPNSLDSEIVKVTAVSSDQNGNTILTATRAQRDTLARAFSAGAIVTNAIYVDDAVVLGQESTEETEQAWVGTDDIEDDAVTPDKISSATYTYDEQVIGTWVDGRPIYRQVVSITIDSSWQTLINVPDAARFIKIQATAKSNNVIPFYNSSSDYGMFYVSANGQNVVVATTLRGQFVAIVEYIKTTD